MKQSWRNEFDEVLDEVLAEMPPSVHELLERVPLHVEDYPSRDVLATTGASRRDQLCGLFTGIPLTERSVWHSGQLPNVVTIYREGILAAAENQFGQLEYDDLFDEIRITVLHELGHHHGLTEDDLSELGYQ